MKEKLQKFIDELFGKKGTLKRELEKYIWSEIVFLASVDVLWEASGKRAILSVILSIVLIVISCSIRAKIEEHIIETYAPEEKEK